MLKASVLLDSFHLVSPFPSFIHLHDSSEYSFRLYYSISTILYQLSLSSLQHNLIPQNRHPGKKFSPISLSYSYKQRHIWVLKKLTLINFDCFCPTSHLFDCWFDEEVLLFFCFYLIAIALTNQLTTYLHISHKVHSSWAYHIFYCLLYMESFKTKNEIK